MNPNQLLSSLGISPPIISDLFKCDFVTIGDVQKLNPSSLADATNLSLAECAEILRLCEGTTFEIKPKSVKELLLEAENDTRNIVSFCRSIDELLGGGFPIGAVTELVGVPGIGKTQLCLQLCISVQIPMEAGGVNGEALYIDTEGSFTAARLAEIANHCIDHLKIAFNMEQLTSDDILKRIHYARCLTYIEMLALIKNLHQTLENSRIKIVIIDSIAFHVRTEVNDPGTRTTVLFDLMQRLLQNATRYNVAVILTNQMTTKITQGTSQLVPALGEAWGHCSTIRLLLLWQNGGRIVRILKAPHLPTFDATFQITAAGIRDCRKRRHSDCS